MEINALPRRTSCVPPVMRAWLVVAFAVVLVAPAVFGSVPFENHQCSLLVLRSDKDAYSVGESVNITVSYSPVLLGCVESMIAHDYVIKIQILNSRGNEEYSSTHVTTGNLTTHETWVPAKEDNYTILASSWLRLAGGQSMVKELEASKMIQVEGASESLTPPSIGLGVIVILVVTMSYFLFRHASSKRQSSQQQA